MLERRKIKLMLLLIKKHQFFISIISTNKILEIQLYFNFNLTYFFFWKNEKIRWVLSDIFLVIIIL